MEITLFDIIWLTLCYVTIASLYVFFFEKIVEDRDLIIASCWAWPIALPIAILICIGIGIYEFLKYLSKSVIQITTPSGNDAQLINFSQQYPIIYQLQFVNHFIVPFLQCRHHIPLLALHKASLPHHGHFTIMLILAAPACGLVGHLILCSDQGICKHTKSHCCHTRLQQQIHHRTPNTSQQTQTSKIHPASSKG